MTTVVATRTAIYTDSQATSNINFYTTKAHRITTLNGATYLVGMCGVLEACYAVLEVVKEFGPFDAWKAEKKPEILKNLDGDSCELVLVSENKELYLLSPNLIPLPCNAPIHAIGSGAQWAIAAIDHGKTPKEAVEYACVRDDASKPPVQTLTFKTRL